MFSYLLKDLNQFDALDKLISKIIDLEDFKILIVNKKLFDKNTIPKSSLQIYYR